MYKTIRHGENSLQYTILPQNDDFRIDGKITGNGNTCGHKSKRGRRRSVFAYLGLLFVCTVIVGAILVPFLVSAECLPIPPGWFTRTRLALLNGSKMSSAEKHDNKTESTITKAYPNLNTNLILLRTTEQPPTTVKSDESAVTLDNIFTIPILSDKNDLLESGNRLFVRTEGNAVIDQAVTEEAPIVVMQKTTEMPIIVSNSKGMQSAKGSEAEAIKRKNEVTMTTIVATTSTVAPQVTTTNIATITTTTTTTKKPIILPVLAKTNSIVRENGKTIEKPGESNNWIRLRWPPVYFQWEGYKTAIILPAILGLALIGIVLLATICLVSRNKKTIVASMKKRNPNDIEGVGEDNATLLTTGNFSDDD